MNSSTDAAGHGCTVSFSGATHQSFRARWSADMTYRCFLFYLVETNARSRRLKIRFPLREMKTVSFFSRFHTEAARISWTRWHISSDAVCPQLTLFFFIVSADSFQSEKPVKTFCVCT